MKEFKLEFEIRRVVFGLAAILRTPANLMPEVIQQKLPNITKELGVLTHRVSEARKKILEDNEKYIANDGASSDDVDALGSDDGDADFEDEDDEAGQEHD